MNVAPATLRSQLCALAVCVAIPAPAFAGMISSVQMFGSDAGTGPGMGTVSNPVVLTVNVDNDNQPGGPGGDNNITVPIKRFDHNGFIDMVFNIVPTNGTTEYKIFESVDDNTGVDWTSYTMELGFGVGSAFVPSPAGDGLDFDAPTYDTPPSSTAFTSVSLAEDMLTFFGGLQSSGSQTYQVRIDVPNLPYTQFTLRQTPHPVPEPASLTLLSLAAASILARRKSRH